MYSKYEKVVIRTRDSQKKNVAKSLYISKELNSKLRELLKEYNKNSSTRISTNEVLNILLEKQIDAQMKLLKEGRLEIY